MRFPTLLVAALVLVAGTADAAKRKQKKPKRGKPAVTAPVVKEAAPPPPVVEAPVVAPAPVEAPSPAPAPTRTTTVTTAELRDRRDEPTDPDPRALRLVTIAIEERPFWRRLRYRDNLGDTLRPSDLVANAVGIDLTVRPLKAARGVAVLGRYERAVGVNGSRTPEGTEFGTASSEWSLGVGFDTRITTLGLGLGLGVAYGQHRFQVDDEAMAAPAGELVPDVTYGYVRAGLTVSVPLAARWDVSAGGGYRHLVGEGELTEAMWFPRATGAGMDAGAMVSFHATRWLEIYARVDMRRYFFAMNPEVGDPWITGGATDQYLGGALGIAVSPR